MENHFYIEKKNIVPLLSAFQPLCTKRTTLDITAHILVQSSNRELVLKGTDLEVSLQASCAVTESKTTTTESFLVPGRRMFESIKEMEGGITCALVDNQLVLQSDGADLRLNIKNPDEFPPFPERIENLMHLHASDFLAMLDHTMFLIPQNNSNPALNGLLLELSPEGLRLTATDGHSLINLQTDKYQYEKPLSWLLPRRAIFELKKLVESTSCQTLFVGTCDGQVVFSGELFNFFTRLIAQPFPDYRPVMDCSNFFEGNVDRSQLLRALRRAACLLSGNFLATRFLFTHEDLRIRMENKGVGTLDERIPVTIANLEEDQEVRFYAPYLIDGLQVFSQQRLKFFIKNSTRPIMCETQENGCTIRYLVMPVAPQSNR
ncbi:MAG: DNA polymerase III subunit beta [Candidatus Babeliaceae bacterium]|nr:DNA polymerase III subunit beta [Candidatus Babeliaceae bacterium]